MTKRKIILLTLIGLFTILYVVQITQIGKSSVENITLESDITGIRISYPDGTKTTFTRQGIPATDTEEEQSMWLADNEIEVEAFPMDRMAGQLKTIRVLGKTSSAENETRYDLQSDKAVIVEALNGQEIVRTIKIGKTSTTASQTYAVIDNSNDIVLVSGNLNDVFNKTANEMIKEPSSIEEL